MKAKQRELGQIDHSDAIVIFGMTGDLAQKMILPALYRLMVNGELDAPIIGVALDELSHDQMAQHVKNPVLAHFKEADELVFTKLVRNISYISGDYNTPNVFERLSKAIGCAKRPMFYLAVPPSLFAIVSRGLQKAGLTSNSRIMVEKPFGRDYHSAKTLNSLLHAVFPENAIFRVDHFLGTEAMENLLYFRFSNSFLEPIWNRNYIESIQITFAEDFGVSDRGAFYDEVGAIRDVVQNHLRNVLLLLAIEPPASNRLESLNDVKVKVLKEIEPLSPNDIVRGQFEGYKKIKGVSIESTRETFVAMQLAINLRRWESVPFFIRTGKMLPINALEVTLRLRRLPVVLFDQMGVDDQNFLRFRLSPKVAIGIGARRKKSGEEMVGELVDLKAVDGTRNHMLPYERLIGDVLRGNRRLFTSPDAAELAWRIFDSVLDAEDKPNSYKKGSWGPPNGMKQMQPPGG